MARLWQTIVAVYADKHMGSAAYRTRQALEIQTMFAAGSPLEISSQQTQRVPRRGKSLKRPFRRKLA